MGGPVLSDGTDPIRTQLLGAIVRGKEFYHD